MSTTGPCTGTEKPFESYISLRNVSSLHRPVPDDNVLEHEGGGVATPEGYVKAVHFATCTFNEDIDFKCWPPKQSQQL